MTIGARIKYNILSLVEDKFFPLYFSAKLVQTLWACHFEIPKLAKLNGLRTFSIDEAKKKKRSDTLFILGGGASINHLSKDEWSDINSSDSIGINLWFVHPHKPTFMLIEGFRETDVGSKRYDFFYNAIRAITEKYANTPFLIKDINYLRFDFDKFPKDIKENARAIPKITIPGTTNGSVRRSLSFITSYNLPALKGIPYSSRASVSFAISLGVIMGYKEIVLCGVDLDGSNYFWEDSSFEPTPEVGTPEHTGQTKGAIHSTIDPSVNRVLIDEVIYDMQRCIASMCDTKLFVSSDRSKLYPRLPCYWEPRTKNKS